MDAAEKPSNANGLGFSIHADDVKIYDLLFWFSSCEKVIQKFVVD
jgi:hypothetical protein